MHCCWCQRGRALHFSCPYIIAAVFDAPRMLVHALWSSLEQQSFMLSPRGLSLPVRNAKVSQTPRAGRLPATPDVLRFQQNTNRQQQQQGMSAASPACLVPGQELRHLSASEGSKTRRISEDSAMFPLSSLQTGIVTATWHAPDNGG